MTPLSQSKNPIVKAHFDEYENGNKLQTSSEMIMSLCHKLVQELEACEETLALANKQKPGTFVLHMPIQYMVENAKPKDVAVYNLLKEQLTKINNGETAAMILPALTDESNNRMFTLEYVGPNKY